MSDLVERFIEATKPKAGEPIPLASRIAALEAENMRLREALAWKPIETAPKDGTKIDVLFPSTGRMADAFWTGNGWGESRWRNQRGGGYTVTFVRRDEEATHWMYCPDLAQQEGV